MTTRVHGSTWLADLFALANEPMDKVFALANKPMDKVFALANKPMDKSRRTGDTADKSRRKATRQTSLAGRRHGRQVSPEGDTADKLLGFAGLMDPGVRRDDSFGDQKRSW
jgi:hypothetical protein